MCWKTGSAVQVLLEVLVLVLVLTVLVMAVLVQNHRHWSPREWATGVVPSFAEAWGAWVAAVAPQEAPADVAASAPVHLPPSCGECEWETVAQRRPCLAEWATEEAWLCPPRLVIHTIIDTTSPIILSPFSGNGNQKTERERERERDAQFLRRSLPRRSSRSLTTSVVTARRVGVGARGK